MYSRVIVMGRITADLELRQTPSSVSVLNFSIAVNRPFVVDTPHDFSRVECQSTQFKRKN